MFEFHGAVLGLCVCIVGCGSADAQSTSAADDAGDVGFSDTSVGADTLADVTPAGDADTGGADTVAVDAAPDADPACAKIARDATFTARVRITCDNEAEVFVNGASVGTTTSWGSPVTLDLSLFLHPSRKNVIAVRGTNTSSQGGNDRGIIGEVTATVGTTVIPLVVTDGAWRTSKDEIAGWSALDFDDSAWKQATEVADHGAAPWGALFGTSSAKWIWSAAVPASTSDKPNLETAYVRRTFYFSLDGTATSSSPSCP